jgi:DNA primase
MLSSASATQAIRDRIEISEVVAPHVKLVRKGHEFHGLCPFHTEKSPSFTVNNAKQFYHCFGCGAHGDAFDFLINKERLSFQEALEILAAKAGITLEKNQTPAQAQQAKKNQTIQSVLAKAADWFAAQLWSNHGQQARDYILKRGFTEAALRHFKVGFSPDYGQAMKAAFAADHINENQLIEAGLLIHPEGEERSYARFRNRIIFPITNPKGEVVAFGGRILETHSSKNPGAKYLNSPESSLFKKGELLFAESYALPTIRKKASVIVVEGYMDTVRLHQYGFTETVATLGTAITEMHLARLWRVASEPIICLDGDAAGLKAAAKTAIAALPLITAERTLRFLTLPQGMDPDDVLTKYGAEGFERLLNQYLPLAEFLWQHALATHPTDTVTEQARLHALLDEMGKAVKDRSVFHAISGYFKDKLYQHRQALRAEARQAAYVSSARRPGIKIPARSSQVTLLAGQSLTEQERLESMLVTMVLNSPEILKREEARDYLVTMEIKQDSIDKLRQTVLSLTAHEENADIPNSKQLIEALKAEGSGEIVSALTDASSMMADSISQFSDEHASILWELYVQKHILAQVKQEYNDYLSLPNQQVKEVRLQSFCNEIKKMQSRIATIAAELQPDTL